MMKKIIFLFYLISTILFAEDAKESTHLSYDSSLSLLQTIQDDAMIYGDGKKIIYVFIDPLCPYSRKFISLISENPKMTSKYQYYLFLYSVPRLKSTDVVSAIYMSSDPLQSLLQTMIDENVHYDKGNKVTKEKVDRIEKIGKEMHVHKRPFIFIKIKG